MLFQRRIVLGSTQGAVKGRPQEAAGYGRLRDHVLEVAMGESLTLDEAQGTGLARRAAEDQRREIANAAGLEE
ncbi:hypothetical protein [Brachybacterium paraconglomeratum]|uniref:hypothetical protein n=1 Tax=Brachybacterium paraconglomeratum TaxID=173362 RepID=UPI0021A33CDC|nr:hypothetical protein [Brachybacterium paraconglomeratum]MCT1909783.1 hypothetical protein [Brachybacterium paraconglomeratum]